MKYDVIVVGAGMVGYRRPLMHKPLFRPESS